MKRIQATVLIILLLLTLIPTGAHASQLNIHIAGPSVIGTNQTVQYRVYVEGYFPFFKCSMIMSGYNLTGAKPTNQVIASSKDGRFIFNITAPLMPQTIYLNFIAYGMLNETKVVTRASRIITVQVKEAMNIKVKIKNTENYSIYNTVLSFYIDEKYIGNTTIKIIKANSTKTIVYKWVPEDLYPGEHLLTVKLSGNGVVFENDKQTYEYKFYYGTPPSYEYITYLSGGLLIFVLVFFVLFMMGRKGKKGASMPKWRK